MLVQTHKGLVATGFHQGDFVLYRVTEETALVARWQHTTFASLGCIA